MANIKKLITKSGKIKWKATVFIGRDENNKQLFDYRNFDKQTDAKLWAHEIEQSVKDGNYGSYMFMRVKTHIEEWFELKKVSLKPSTRKSYKMYIDFHFEPFFGDMKMKEVNEKVINRYIAQKLKTISPNTVRKHFFTLKQIFEIMRANNPCLYVKPPKYVPPKKRVVSDVDFAKMEKLEKHSNTEIYIMLTAYCGLREGEIAALKKNDIDIIKNTIRIDENLAINEESKYEFGDPKSLRGNREIIAPQFVIDKLITRMKNLKEDDRILPYRPDAISRNFNRFCVRYNFKGISLHDLRHYQAKLLHDNNVDDLYAAERMGHDIWVLKKIYQAFDDEKKKEHDEKVINIFSKRISEKKAN